MNLLQFVLRKLLYGIPLLFGVTLISFLLMVYFGPDQTYQLLGKNASEEQIAEIRHELGYDRPFITRYAEYVKEVATFDFGTSNSSGEQVSEIFAQAVPVTLMVELPGFILGNIIAIAMALIAAFYRSRWQDKSIMIFSVIGMSISILIVIMLFQVFFCSSYGLGYFPITGWEINSISDYVYFVTVPTLITIFVALGYNTRFYRAILVEEMNRDHVRTARAYGASAFTLLYKNVFRNSLIPIVTRIMLSIPYLIIGGSLLIESYFSIPGVGFVTYEAITNGNQPVVKAVVAMSAVLYVVILILTDIFYRVVDPRISLR